LNISLDLGVGLRFTISIEKLNRANGKREKTMQSIIIDEEFKFLLPTLDKETYARLEEDIINNGCRDALVLWENILIDGYNRYAICTEHDIPFNTVDMELDTREDALIWIITNQVSRRNLTPIQLTHFRGVHYRAEKKNQGLNNRFIEKSTKRQNDVLYKTTAQHLAERYKVSPRTIDRDAKTAAAIDAIGEKSPEAKRKILAGEMQISRKDLKEFSAMQTEELSDTVTKIENGTFEKPNHATSTVKESQKSESTTAGTQTLNTLISRITGGAYFDLQEFSGNKVSAKSKAALRTHIDMLEDLYSRI